MRNALFVVTMLALMGSISATSRISRYTGQTLSNLQTRYSGVAIALETTESRYFQGEDVYFHYRITCSPPRPQPWYPPAISSATILFRNGDQVDHMIVGGVDQVDSGRAEAGFEGTYLQQSFYSAETEEQFGFKHLLPGHYVGYFDMGIVSPDFSFDIDPVPDSLQGRWNEYCELGRLMNIPKRAPTTDPRDVLDRSHERSQLFLDLPSGAVWRKEALSTANVLLGRYREAWQATDSIACEQVLIELANEPEVGLDVVSNGAWNSLFKGFTFQQAASAYLALAQRSGRIEAIRDAQRWVEQSNR